MKKPNDIISGGVEIHPADLFVVGAPWDHGSSYLRGPALAPARIRAALTSPARSLVTESGVDLGQSARIRWLDDLDLDATKGTLDPLTEITARIVGAGARLLVLGGDHSITPAVALPMAERFPDVTVVQIDAHPDLYDVFEGDRSSHACPMARIMETGQVRRLVQIGIRAMTPAQAAQAERFDVEVLAPSAWSSAGLAQLEITGPVYLSLDLDGLDPAFAPGVSHPEPGGLSTRQTIEIIQGLPLPVVGADIVELNPVQDQGDLTALVAAKLSKEILARMLSEPLS